MYVTRREINMNAEMTQMRELVDDFKTAIMTLLKIGS